VYDALADGKPARDILPTLSEDELADVGRLGLLTGKEVGRDGGKEGRRKGGKEGGREGGRERRVGRRTTDHAAS